MITYPGLPAPAITPFLTREASRAQYAPGTEFAIDQLTMVGNTGTYLDAPYHRFADGADLAAIPLQRTAGLPAVLIRVTGAQSRGIGTGALAAVDVRGKAVLLHTRDDIRFGTPGYADGAHFLTGAGAELAGRPGRGPGWHRRDQYRRHRRPRPPGAHGAARGRHPGRRAPDRAGSAAPGRCVLHRRAAPRRGPGHHPGPRLRPAPRLTARPPFVIMAEVRF